MWITFYLMLLLTSSNPADHNIHLSVAEVDFNGNAIHVSLKVFYDDLQLAVGLTPGQALPDKYKGADALIKEYIHQNFAILDDENNKVDLKYIESNGAPPAVWVELKGEVKDSNQYITIQNRLLIDLFSDQKNIVHCQLDSKKETLSFDRKKIQCSFPIAKNN